MAETTRVVLAEGRSNAGIAHRIWVTEGTVEKHIRSIINKLSLLERRVRTAPALRPGADSPRHLHYIWPQLVLTTKRLNRIRRDTDHIHVVGVQHPTGSVEEKVLSSTIKHRMDDREPPLTQPPSALAGIHCR
jgi:hypothetical protein